MALEQQGLKAKDLALRLEWPESRVSKLLSGKQSMTVEDLSRMADELGIDVGTLFDPPNGAKGVYDGWDQLALAV